MTDIESRDLSFKYSGASYLADISVKDYKNLPLVNIEIKNKDVTIAATLKKTDEDIKISGLEATFGNTKLSCSGRIKSSAFSQ